MLRRREGSGALRGLAQHEVASPGLFFRVALLIYFSLVGVLFLSVEFRYGVLSQA